MLSRFLFKKPTFKSHFSRLLHNRLNHQLAEVNMAPPGFVHKGASDPRVYKFIELPANRLPCLLISDPDTEKSAAALDVRTGSLADPVELPGLAHFCEHMLFLGVYLYFSKITSLSSIIMKIYGIERIMLY